jgi:diaminohydroxyphosphoribosylaminopyrimidine deaminase/5-amino-6-(5-phosphoribosylamino)uracil reductase
MGGSQFARGTILCDEPVIDPPRQPNEDATREQALWARLLALAAAGRDEGPAPDDPFWRLYGPIARGRGEPAFVVGQLGQSIDGRIATATGHSHYVNGPETIVHLHRLRALVDAVVVGIGTVIADDPQLTVRRARGRNPARVVIDPQGRLPAKARLLSEGGAPVYAVQGADHPRPEGVIAITLPAEAGRLDPHAIVQALAARGFTRLLIEGGAATVSSFLAAGALDRLHIAVAPVLIGSGLTGIALPAIDRLDQALRPAMTLHRLGEDLLFDCEFVRKLPMA